MLDTPRVRAPAFPDGLDWVNADRPIRLADLRGRFVLLDFWTYGCVNCLHVLPDLTRLEAEFADVLTVIGVHSAKFAGEGGTDALRHAVDRLGIAHPVVNDAALAVWSLYAVKAWPTLVLVDPEGYVCAQRSGEGAYEPFADALRTLVPTFEAKGALTRGDAVRPTPPSAETVLRFPGKVHAYRDRLFVADTGHDRIVVTDLDGRVVQTVGGGGAGFEDGPFAAARFRAPQGLWYDAETERLYVADAGNHALRVVDFEHETVATLAGSGAQAAWGTRAADGAAGALNSPWDVLLHRPDGDAAGVLYAAMAGSHQLWRFDVATGQGEVYAGNGYEHLVDGPRLDAQLAQPSGLAADGTHLYFADAETSALRRVPLGAPEDAAVETLVGEGLFSFGDTDGDRASARMQHALGVAAGPDGALFVADTYNHRIRRYAGGALDAFAGTGAPGANDGSASEASFDEPGGLFYADGVVYVADTNNHAIRAVDARTGAVRTLDVREPASETGPKAPEPEAVRLPAQRLAPGDHPFTLDVLLPDGFHPNDLDEGTFAVRTVRGAAVVMTPEVQPLSEPSTFSVTVPEGRSEVEVSGQALFCDDEGGLCRVYPFRLRLPLVGAVGGASGPEPVEVRVEA